MEADISVLRVHVGEFVFVCFVLLDSDHDDVDLDDRDGEWVPPVFKISGYSLSKGMGIGKYVASDTFVRKILPFIPKASQKYTKSSHQNLF